MKKHTYQFSFADLNISLKTEWPVSITKNFRPFLIQQIDKINDGIFEYHTSDVLERIQGKLLYQDLQYDAIRQESGNIMRVFKDHKEQDLIYA